MEAKESPSLFRLIPRRESLIMPNPRSLSVPLLVLFFVASSAVQAQVTVEPSEPRVHELSRDEQVRALYSEVAGNLQAAGHDLTLEIHHLATVPRKEFGRYQTYQVFSLGEGLCLRIEPIYSQTNVRMPDGSSREAHAFATFDLVWKPDYWLMHADAERAELFHSIRAQNFADYMETAARDDERLETVDAATSFEVRLRHAGRERVYRAVALWLPSDFAESELILVDRILLQLDSALDPPWPIRPLSAVSGQPDEIPEDLLSEIRKNVPGTLENASTQCTSTIKRHNNFNSLVGTEEHSGTGKHRSIVGVEFECRCTTDCTSTCRPSFDSLTCDDRTPIASGRKHVAATSQKVVNDQVVLPDSLNSGAKDCSAGFGCVFRSCLLTSATCDVSVSVTADGDGSINFSTSGASYELNLDFNFAGCAPCEPDTTNCLMLGGGAVCGDDPESIPNPDCQEGPCSPIVIDVARDGFRFTGLADAVRFDIDADGALDRITWTDPASDEAFLVLDRNQNQVIDDGRELFGVVTEQPGTDDRNGFLALAVFDERARGGNGDGVISPEDSIFESLHLWKDGNQDGISQPAELRSLQVSGIVAIELSYITSGRRDRYGNALRWTSFVQFSEDVVSGHALRFAAADVIFVPAE